QPIGQTLTLLVGQWSLNNTDERLADGTHTFTARTIDLLGNVSETSFPFTVRIDTQAPDAPVISGFRTSDGSPVTDGTTAENTATIDGTSEPGSLVTLSRNYQGVGSVTADGNGAWSFTDAPLADGTSTYQATATDVAGNVGAASAAATLTVETGSPATS